MNEIIAKIDDYDLQLSPQEKTKVRTLRISTLSSNPSLSDDLNALLPACPCAAPPLPTPTGPTPQAIAEVELVCSKLQACSEASITAPGSAVALHATARAIALQAIALAEAVRSPSFSWHPQALRDAGIEDCMLMVFVGAAIDAAAPG